MCVCWCLYLRVGVWVGAAVYVRLADHPSPFLVRGGRVLDAQIQEGWRRDADDYTTACPYPECAAANGTDECKTASASPRKRGKDTPEDGPPKNAVRFVARFAVSSKAPFWEGSTGESSLLLLLPVCCHASRARQLTLW